MRAYVKPGLRKIVIERDKGCIYCGLPVVTVTGDDAPYSKQWRAFDDRGRIFHFEHKVPLVAGGLNDETNIVLACPSCNLDKARKERSKRAYEGGAAMSKVIKVEDGIYTALDRLRVGRQTFSDVCDDLLKSRLLILEAMNMLEGQIKFREWQRGKLEKLAVAQEG